MNILNMEMMTIVVLMAVYDDLIRYKISNKIIAVGIVMAGIYLGIHLVLGIWIDRGLLLSIDSLIKNSLYGMSIGFLGMFIMYMLGATGAGDVKLMGVIGLIGGVRFVRDVLLYSLISGGVLGIWGMKLHSCDKIDRYGKKMHRMHYSLAIAVGVAAAFIKNMLTGGGLCE